MQQNAREVKYIHQAHFKSMEFERNVDMIKFSKNINELELKKKKKIMGEQADAGRIT